METKEILKKINSVRLCMMAHPDNEPNSEFADRINDLTDIQHVLDERLPSDVITILIGWEQFKKANWWESDVIDVEKKLMHQFKFILAEKGNEEKTNPYLLSGEELERTEHHRKKGRE